MNNFFSELKRRNVVRVGVAYMIVAWVVVQFIELVSDIMNFPETLPQIILILLVAGFPIVLIISWAFEVTPEGVKKTKEVDKSKSVTHGTGQKLNKLIAGGFVLALGFIVYQNFIAGPEDVVQEAAAGQASIAVLPFADLSSAGDQEYFADGISEEILNVLAKTKGLSVASRTSSFQFKGQNQDIQAIANQLGVETVLEGSIRKDGNTLRITAQLINASDGFHIWSETYDRELTSIFAIQDEIAGHIATSLLGTFGMQALPEERFKGTDNAEAYNLYLRGNFLRATREVDALLASVKVYEDALKLDPNYADAWAGLGKAYQLILNFGGLDQNFARLKGLEAANKALSLDPENGLAYAVLGLRHLQDFNFKDAKPFLDKALELRPQDAEVHFWNGIYLSDIGDIKGAVTLYERGYELDPYIITLQGWLMDSYLALGDRKKAERLVEEIKTLGGASENYVIKFAEMMFAIWDDDLEKASAIASEGEFDDLIMQYKISLLEKNEEKSAELFSELKTLSQADLSAENKVYVFMALGEFENANNAIDGPGSLGTFNLRNLWYHENPEVDPEYLALQVDIRPLLRLRPEFVQSFADIGIDILKEAGLDE